ncbi:MAG: hypothetical protein LBV44_04040 [Methylobacillus sp.]|nr:hypothetical protein [Methylobacillus sp.]
MDNKYGLGSAKMSHVAHERHAASHQLSAACHRCGGTQLILCATLNDHFCKDCGEYQNDIPAGYTTGRSENY